MTNDEKWNLNFEALKTHVAETGHFPNKHDKRLNWAKFQMKKIKAGMMEPERQRLFEELMAMRSGEHTGGRKKASHDDTPNLFCQLENSENGPA